MNRTLLAMSLRLVVLLALAAPMETAVADFANESKVVNGMAFYLGVMPAQIVRGHPLGHTESEMHGGPPSGSAEYHVMVAIFDAATGKRVTDARVEARVQSLGLGGQEKVLQRMPIAGALTYGNYFTMAGSGPFWIILRVSRPSLPSALEIRFEHRHQ